MLNIPENIKELPCPVEKTLAVVGSKWSLLIMRELNNSIEPMRYNELLRSLKPISSKTLSSKLKDLVEYYVVKKEVDTTTPIKVFYSLSVAGILIFPTLNPTRSKPRSDSKVKLNVSPATPE